MNEIELPPKQYLLGEEKELAIIVRDESGGSLAGASATLTVYDSTGAVVSALNGVSMSTSGTTRLRVYRMITTGPGKNITTSGDYTAIIQLTIGTTKRGWKIPLKVVSH